MPKNKAILNSMEIKSRAGRKINQVHIHNSDTSCLAYPAVSFTSKRQYLKVKRLHIEFQNPRFFFGKTARSRQFVPTFLHTCAERPSQRVTAQPWAVYSRGFSRGCEKPAGKARGWEVEGSTH